jgi:hypothetical protein
VVNGQSTPEVFGLADLLVMRAREAERFFSRGGVMACYAYPDVSYAGVEGQPGWTCYSWLPAPEGFQYGEHLLPGFGKPNLMVEEGEFLFAPFVEQFQSRLAYRVHLDEGAPEFGEYATVFARSPGGTAVAVELAILQGRMVLLPPFARMEKERAEVARSLFECFERLPTPIESKNSQLVRKEAS